MSQSILNFNKTVNSSKVYAYLKRGELSWKLIGEKKKKSRVGGDFDECLFPLYPVDLFLPYSNATSPVSHPWLEDSE